MPTLKRVKSYLQSIMNEQRLSDLLSIERELSSNVSLDDVVEFYCIKYCHLLH